ncbi:GNAT family N-acetyltransferase [Paenibacillus contaminans]|nr:GNAT family N-acetyltransferase [Paenibacillus contaminans]
MSVPLIRTALPTDIQQISKIHKEQFGTHFLGKYSISLIEKFYLSFMQDTVFMVSETAGVINGFVLGGMNRDLELAKQRFLSANKRQYVAETLTTPGLYLPVIQRVSKNLTKSKEESVSPSKIPFRLLSISVSSHAKGRGVAEKLVQAFENEIASLTAYGLSVKKTNERAIGFYHKMGFEVEVEQPDCYYFVKKLG